MKKTAYVFFLILASAVLLYSCGPSGDVSQKEGPQNETAQNEEGAIEKMRKRAAQKGVDYIQKPVEKARKIEEQARRRVEDLNSMGE